MQALRHWQLSVQTFNDHHRLSPEEGQILKRAFDETSIPNATFWESDPGDSPAQFTLPSLNSPGSKVTLRGGPFTAFSIPGVPETGFIRGMARFPLELNCCPEEVTAVRSFVKNVRSGPSGLVFSGCKVWASSNRVEGRFLAIAARLSQHWPVRVVLAGEIAAQLVTEDTDKLLGGGYLLIPDLEMWSAVVGPDRLLTNRLIEVLKERVQRRMPTIVYAEESPTLDPGLASLLSYRYRRLDLSKVTPITAEDLSHRV
jgi:hypothetical protein